MTEDEINKIVARVILSTKRKSRQYSLFEIALDIDALKKIKGNMNEVAKTVGVSAGMLNQFLSVFKLPTPLVELVKERKIDSVSLVHNLSKLKEKDSLGLIELMKAGNLSSQDLRILIPYRKQNPNESINELVERIIKSKNIKVSVIKISRKDLKKSIDEFQEQVALITKSENVIEIIANGENIDLKINKEGEILLRASAKKANLTLHEIIDQLLK